MTFLEAVSRFGRFSVDPQSGLWFSWVVSLLVSLWLGEAFFVVYLAGTVSSAFLLFIILAFLVPPPRPLSETHALVRRLTQAVKTAWATFVLLVGAFLGAFVAFDLQSSVRRQISFADAVARLWATYFEAVVAITIVVVWLGIMACGWDLMRTCKRRREAAMHRFLDRWSDVQAAHQASAIRVWIVDLWSALTTGWVVLVVAFLSPFFLVLVVLAGLSTFGEH